MIDSNETIMYENGRDAGFADGYAYGLEANVKKLNPKPNEVVILEFDPDKVCLEDVSNAIDRIMSPKFPANTIAAVPCGMSLYSCDKEFLQGIVRMISEVADEL